MENINIDIRRTIIKDTYHTQFSVQSNKKYVYRLIGS